MRNVTLLLLTGLIVFALEGRARAGKGGAATRQQIEQDLAIEARPFAGARVRPAEAIRLQATLVNRSEDRTHKIVDPGPGSELGFVEPFVYYTARYQPHDGEARTIEPEFRVGMCGLGDYRWIPRVRDLGPGASLEFGNRMASATMTLDVKQPGRYDLRVHYEYRRKGTSEVLPMADPKGELGPMKSIPRFKISSEPVRFDVVRPFEVFVGVTGKLEKGVRTQLSRLVTVRVENWSKEPLTIANNKLKLRVELLPGSSARIQREPMAMPAIVLTKTLQPGEGFTAIGPEGGWFDEEWTSRDGGAIKLRVVATGHAPNAAAVASHAVTLPGS